MVALPPNLFRTTAIPACLWFMTRDKSPQGAKALADRRGEILFIDARGLGTMVDRTERILTDEDLARIADTYHVWRGTRSAKAKGRTYENVAGFCHSASLDEVAAHDHVLAPGRYVGTTEAEEDPNAEALPDRIDRLAKELYAHFDESSRIEAAFREHLGALDV
jgi:type I restriction enzyme M protein